MLISFSLVCAKSITMVKLLFDYSMYSLQLPLLIRLIEYIKYADGIRF